MKIDVPGNGKFYTTEDDRNAYFTAVWLFMLDMIMYKKEIE